MTFHERVAQRSTNIRGMFDAQTTLFFKPYNSETTQGDVLFYPIQHLIHFLRDLYTLSEGIFLCAFSPSYERFQDTGAQFLNLFLDVINCIVSIFSLVTRNSASILQGYNSTCKSGTVAFDDYWQDENLRASVMNYSL